MIDEYETTVLIADADVQVRTLVASILKDAGAIEVFQAARLEAARHEIAAKAPGVVITEARLAGEDGLALVEWLRRSPESPAPDTPAILLTGLTFRDLVARARNAGVHTIIAKPFSAQTLVSSVRRALDDPRPFVRSVSYVGPCRRVRVEEGRGARRLADDDDDPSLAEPAHCARLAIYVDALALSAAGLDPAARGPLRRLRDRTCELGRQARAENDGPLAEAAGSLERYIDACGLSGRLDPEVVDIHIATMRILTNAERRRDDSDRDVIDGLHEMVARRLAAA